MRLVELHSSGVQVTLVEPGSVATPIWDKGRAEAERLSYLFEKEVLLEYESVS